MTRAAGLAVVGDVHGDAACLEDALRDLARSGRRIVFVGDYVNRGPDSRRVLELLADARSELGERLVLLRGNHDDALLEFLVSGRSARFLWHGGLVTMRSYLGDSPPADAFEVFRARFPSLHWDLLANAEPYFETDDVLVSHAGINPDSPSSRDTRDMVLGTFPALFTGDVDYGKDLVVCGHYVQHPPFPFVSQHFICVDTGCGTDAGPLTALMLPERTIRTYGGWP